MKTLSLIVNDLNDHHELIETLRSALATAPHLHEIIVIDDQSDTPLVLTPDLLAQFDTVIKLHRPQVRLGCGQSRHLAAEMSTGDVLLIVDSHMRFTPGWYEEAAKRIFDRPNTIHCGTCLGLKDGAMDPLQPCAVYTGATLNIFGADPNKSGQTQVFEGIWKDHPTDDSELACLMGACYFVPRELFFRLGGLKALREWGSDEPYLSVKAWLSGCEIRLLRNVLIGHKFRDKSPYEVNWSSLAYNKIRSLMTCFNDTEAAHLLTRMAHNVHFMEAMRLIARDREEIRLEREFNQKLFTRNLQWFCHKFALPYPV